MEYQDGPRSLPGHAPAGSAKRPRKPNFQTSGYSTPLPPRSPELNPVENVWQFMRENWLSNRVFQSYEDIVALCCDAWNNLVERPWKIMSIGMCQWAHG